MKTVLAAVAAFGAVLAALAGAPAAHADPGSCSPMFGGAGCCLFLGQNYDVWYDCLNAPPGIAGGYGTANNPPQGGSALVPGGDAPTVDGREPGWCTSGPACSS